MNDPDASCRANTYQCVPRSPSTKSMASERQIQNLREHWRRWLMNWTWQLIVTITVSDAKLVRVECVYRQDALERVIRQVFNHVNRKLFGRNWSKSGTGLCFVLCKEIQKRGMPHYHGVVGGIPIEMLPRAVVLLRAELAKRIGHSRTERIQAVAEALAYSLKFSAAQNDVMWSVNFGRDLAGQKIALESQ